jgi:hypothetical protein
MDSRELYVRADRRIKHPSNHNQKGHKAPLLFQVHRIVDYFKLLLSTFDGITRISKLEDIQLPKVNRKLIVYAMEVAQFCKAEEDHEVDKLHCI